MTNDMYQICTRCVMDTSDPLIEFDDKGVCNHCHDFDNVISKKWHPNKEGLIRLNKMVEKIKKEGSHKEYDCLLGMSGGVDSSYLALKVKELGLRPLVMHVDSGWNSELAVKNIEAVLDYCNYDLHTKVINWEDMKQLQLAYLRSGVANQDVPQDHAFICSRFDFMNNYDIKYILSGVNIATESIFPKSWMYSNRDATNLKSIYEQYGSNKLSDYKTMSFFKYYIYYPFIKRIATIHPLNYMRYDKSEAIAELQKKTKWRPYERKHGESIFTRFFQDYYLIERYGYDKRRPHFSSSIMSKQLTRDQALIMLSEPTYNESSLREDIYYFKKKLELSDDEFDKIMKAPLKKAEDFSTDLWKYKLLKAIQKKLELFTGNNIRIHAKEL
jgi:aminotransferase